ncbi:MAG: class I SAM-dependent methyltransferase [Bacilli bacterium]|jgi:tRNA (adenine22-N1)-methyltransferase
MMRLSQRLQAIAAFVNRNSVVADVGADHGKLLLYLSEKGLIAKGYGIENKAGPFEILKTNLKRFASSDLRPRLQDGISHLEGDVDTLILAGLGGETIIRILKDGENNLAQIKTIITDSHTSIGEVRRQIVSLGFAIAEEQLVNERQKYYEITKFVRVLKPIEYSDFEYRHGPHIIRSPEFRAYAQHLIRKINLLITDDLPPDIKEELRQEREVLQKYEN